MTRVESPIQRFLEQQERLTRAFQVVDPFAGMTRMLDQMNVSKRFGFANISKALAPMSGIVALNSGLATLLDDSPISQIARGFAAPPQNFGVPPKLWQEPTWISEMKKFQATIDSVLKPAGIDWDWIQRHEQIVDDEPDGMAALTEPEQRALVTGRVVIAVVVASIIAAALCATATGVMLHEPWWVTSMTIIAEADIALRALSAMCEWADQDEATESADS